MGPARTSRPSSKLPQTAVRLHCYGRGDTFFTNPPEHAKAWPAAASPVPATASPADEPLLGCSAAWKRHGRLCCSPRLPPQGGCPDHRPPWYYQRAMRGRRAATHGQWGHRGNVCECLLLTTSSGCDSEYLQRDACPVVGCASAVASGSSATKASARSGALEL